MHLNNLFVFDTKTDIIYPAFSKKYIKKQKRNYVQNTNSVRYLRGLLY